MSVGIFCRERVIRWWNGCNLGKEGDLGEKKGGIRVKEFFCAMKKVLTFAEKGV